jgi:nitrite reductase (NADH) small subunit
MSVSVLDDLWIDVCAVTDIPLRGARRISAAATPVAIFRTGDGSIYALEDRCPHKQGPLSMGIVHEASVTCPLHAMRISLVTGELLGADVGKGCAETVKCRIVAGRIQLPAAALQ